MARTKSEDVEGGLGSDALAEALGRLAKPSDRSPLSSTVERLLEADPESSLDEQADPTQNGSVRFPRPGLVYHVFDASKFKPASADAIRAGLAKSGWRPISGPYYRGELREDSDVAGIPQAEVYVMSTTLAKARHMQMVREWLKNPRFVAIQRARRSTRGMLPQP